jgi:hypothetical protein
MVPPLVKVDGANSAWRLYFAQLEYNDALIRFFLMIVPSERRRRAGRPCGVSGVRALRRVGTVVNP